MLAELSPGHMLYKASIFVSIETVQSLLVSCDKVASLNDDA